MCAADPLFKIYHSNAIILQLINYFLRYKSEINSPIYQIQFNHILYGHEFNTQESSNTIDSVLLAQRNSLLLAQSNNNKTKYQINNAYRNYNY